MFAVRGRGIRAKLWICINMLFGKQIQFIESLEDKMFDTLRKSLETHAVVVQNYVVERQLYDKGIDGNEKRLKGYTRSTIRYKISKGQPVDRTTLKDEGFFHASITIDTYADRFEVSSNVSYAKYLIKRYGENIVRPSVVNMKEFFKLYFVPDLKKYIDGKFAR